MSGTISYELSRFHMKITASVTKSSHQDCGPCIYIYLFFLIHVYSGVRIGFNMISKYHTLPVVYTMLV